MKFEEFVKNDRQYINAITTVYKLVHSEEESLNEIVRFQGNREVDKFRESLTIYSRCGSGIIMHAIGEMKLVMAKLSRLQSINPHLELPEPQDYINMLPPSANSWKLC